MKTFLILFKTESTPFSSKVRLAYINEWNDWIQKLRITGSFQSGSFFLKERELVISGVGSETKSYTPKSHKDILRGYMLFEAEDIKEAAEIVKQCPVFSRGGEVSVRELDSLQLQ